MAEDIPRIARQPREIADCVGAFMKEGDMEGIVSMFHPDCQIFFPPDRPPSVGLDGVRRIFSNFVNSRPVLKSEVTSEVINGDVALLRANWSLSAADGTPMADGRSIEVAKRLEHGGWGYFIDCPLGAPILNE